MPEKDRFDRSSSAIARRTLLVMTSLALAGSLLGVVSIRLGTVTGVEQLLIYSCVLFTVAILVALLARYAIAFETIATVATIYFCFYLCAGTTLEVLGSGNHETMLVYLLWFFPLMVFNRLVNPARRGRTLAVILRGIPPVLLASLWWRMVSIFKIEFLLLLVVYCLSYVAYGVMLRAATRYREAYLLERERTKQLKAEAEILDSISDCFLSLDAEFRLNYLNDSACLEFGVERGAVLQCRLEEVLPRSIAEAIVPELRAAGEKTASSFFEARVRTHRMHGVTHEPGAKDVWYELRCFPRSEGMSVYFRNVTDRIAAEARIQHLAFHDALTGLPNRLFLREGLAKALDADAPGAVLYIDLDDFKGLNDISGHPTGDLLLQRVATRLRSCVRRHDIVARLGGDEFVVLVERLSEDPTMAILEAKGVAEQILKSFLSPFELNSTEYNGTASIGIAMLEGDAEESDATLQRADMAMYRAKSQGGNSICFFDPAMETLVAARAALKADLRRALQHCAFTLYYQPQLDMAGHVFGAEALLRWHHPLRGMVPPSEFIPLAEEAGLIIELGRWVLESACLQLAAWSTQPGMDKIKVSVNVSLRQFLDPDFVEIVREVLLATGANPRKLTLEMTESFAMTKVDETIAKMQALRAYGVEFSLDDFGTGYSSLSHLKRLPLDQLKIDQSFVRDIFTDEKDTSITRTIIALGRDLNLMVIAEGVETEQQRQLLEAQGCLAYQGYLYSPAVPAADFEGLVGLHGLHI